MLGVRYKLISCKCNNITGAVMKMLNFVLAFALCAASVCFAQEKSLVIDDFEGALSGGPEGTVDFGTGGDSKVEVSAASDIKNTGTQSIKIAYDAKPGGYMWVARGFDLDVKMPSGK